MELFKVLVIIGILGVVFGLFPLWIWFEQKIKNKNRIKKINIRKLMIFYYVVMAILVVGFIGFIYLDKKYDITKPKPKIYTISEPKEELEGEWFEGYNFRDENHQIKKYHKSDGYDPDEHFGNCKDWQGRPCQSYSHDVNHLVIGHRMIKKKWTFYGFNGLYTNGHHPESFPTDLAPFVKNPFDKWHEPRRENIDKFGVFFTKKKRDDSQFDDMFITDHSNHYIELNYEDPKWLIEEDKDFFMDEVECTSNVRNKETGGLESKIYYLHFNPVKNYITLYTKKFNTTKEQLEKENK